MFSKEAIEALQEGNATLHACKAMALSGETKQIVALPSHFTTHDLENYLPNRRRARGLMKTSTIDAYAGYVAAHQEAGAMVFVNQDDMSATAVLNLGGVGAPRQADNLARLQIKKTAAYTALLAHANGNAMKQATAAEFLEDWQDDIQCFKDADVVATPKAIAAMRKLSIESIRKMESSDQQLSASRSAFESVTATSVDPLPTIIYFSCEPYAELEARLFVLRLGVMTSGDKPSITLRIVRAESHAEEMATELAALTAKSLAEAGTPVLLGAYTRGA